jgi:hypothetical protein
MANMQNPDNVGLLVDEANSPVSHPQPELAPLAGQHLYIAKPGLGKPFNGLLHLATIMVR